MDLNNFSSDRLAAASEFAQTMIVVDDQAGISVHEPVDKLVAPTRRTARSAADENDVATKVSEVLHQLDSKLLIDTAMELGLICSVLCPQTKDEDIVGRVVKAAARVDIVSLDWEMFNDSGETARKLIKGIVYSDLERFGRLRLISIYTGDKRLDVILSSIFESFSLSDRETLSLRLGDSFINGKGGLKIVCLFKKHGTQVPAQFSNYQVSESELPNRLLNEFASITEGLLSNVALAAVASIRGVAHHLLSRFNGNMDGPYFLHRAAIVEAEEAEQYALDIVLSELKNLVDRDGVVRRWAGASAISNRIDVIAKGSDHLDFHFQREGKPFIAKAAVTEVKDFVIQGRNKRYLSFTAEPKPNKNDYEHGWPSVFSTSIEDADNNMHEFASLTGIRAFPGSRMFNDGSGALPVLRLGSILRKAGEYWLCLQAACDSVRVKTKTAFFFVPLGVATSRPQHVVPLLSPLGSIDYIGLDLIDKAYTKSVSFTFEPILCDASLRVAAARTAHGGFVFTDIGGFQFEWIGDLKQRRALRVSQQLGADLSRIGFDEFEPFRS
ncbi:response regulator receiver domain [Pseudomonas petrae]|uniref:Response regulator receiver domain n=1 Tax=Pseudomonas petrae TaxID=2912190 RepID=A0ABS9IDC7_9PSED|nr:response regulator receiver domain [Pseudomonas petrae]MCF7535478.1 response regulator receiver domain [Pseudomonas petrae]MCF7540330.1 response regulator receiver domain [Pseudomonas petrae]MCF7545730.1 response regulator receiver domain [Pseudomonas petrae]